MKYHKSFPSQLPTGIFVAVVTLGLAGCGGEVGPSNSVNGELPPPDFSDEVEAVLAKRIELVKQLAADAVVVEAVKAANENNAGLSEAEIDRLDSQWQQTEGIDEFIKSMITNPCAEHLVDFQEARNAFPEIFVTDRYGLIVAETNKTSDYLQADESWWTKAFDDGRGHTHHGAIEYDESARSEAISIYVPVMDPDTQHAIGVIKAVCDITAIKMEL
jgi:hypothetical protein